MGDFYDATYANFTAEIYAKVRADAFGEDLGQNSWLTADELERFAGWLDLDEASDLLDVGCGSGGPCLRLAERIGCGVQGVDNHGNGVTQANTAAVSLGIDKRVRFDTLDASRTLPYPNESFDAVMCVEVINHLRNRADVLAELARVVKPGGRVLFTDPMVVTGALSHKEIVTRSAIGSFTFVPPGEDERCIREAGLSLLRAEDATPAVAEIAFRWRAARGAREAGLRDLEGDDGYEDFQGFLDMVELLARERRMSRFVFLAEKPDSDRPASETDVE